MTNLCYNGYKSGYLIKLSPDLHITSLFLKQVRPITSNI